MKHWFLFGLSGLLGAFVVYAVMANEALGLIFLLSFAAPALGLFPLILGIVFGAWLKHWGWAVFGGGIAASLVLLLDYLDLLSLSF